MPFDAQVPAEVTARARMIRLRDFLAALPDERFDYGIPVTFEECGTAFCIGGWARELFFRGLAYEDVHEIGRSVGLSEDQADELFYQADGEVTRTRAVAVLDHFLATGEIDWTVA